MRHADCVHVCVLDGFNVQLLHGFAQATARIRPERVPAHTLKNHAAAVDVDAVAVTDLNRAKTKPLLNMVKYPVTILEPNLNQVKIRCFCRPVTRRGDLSLE